MLNLAAVIGLASTLSLPTRTFPFDSTPNWSIIGATAPQLGHQGAQAHINTGNGDFNTMLSKLPSLTIIKYKQKRDTHDAEFGRHHRAGINV